MVDVSEKRALRTRIRILRTITWLFGLALIAMSVYWVYKQIDPDYGPYGTANYNTPFEWYHFAAVVGLTVFSGMFYVNYDEEYTKKYEQVLRGVVVGKFERVSGSLYHTDTTYYLTIQGFTKAGEENRYTTSVSPVRYGQVEKGQHIEL